MRGTSLRPNLTGAACSRPILARRGLDGIAKRPAGTCAAEELVRRRMIRWQVEAALREDVGLIFSSAPGLSKLCTWSSHLMSVRRSRRALDGWFDVE